MKKKQIVLFSGRFQPPHPSHFITIRRIAEEYGCVKVVILNCPKKRFPVCFVEKVMRDNLLEIGLDIQIFVNKTHFGKITFEQLREFQPFDLYAAGNLDVLKYVESLGVKCIYVARQYGYKASKIEIPSE